MEKPVSVTELSGNFAMGLSAFNKSRVFEKGETQSVPVVDWVCQADVFLASFATSGAEECRAEFKLVGFRDTSGVHEHRGVTTKFGKPVILLIGIRRVVGLSKQRSAGYSKSDSGRLDETSTQRHFIYA